MTDTNNDPQQVVGTQAVTLAEAPKKGWLSKLFNKKTVTSFVLGAVVSAGVKSVVCSLLASTSAPAIIAAAATAGAVKGSYHFYQQRKEARNEGKDVPNWKEGTKTIATHAGMSALGALTFGLIDNFVDFGVCEKISSLFNSSSGAVAPVALEPANVVEEPLEVPEVVVTPPAETVVETPSESEFDDAAELSAQELKDRGYCKFNGFCGMDKDQVGAVEDFKAADAMGNSGAGIDLAYSEYWGKGGLEMNKEHAIEKMQDVLEKMRDAGKGNTAEYDRGEDLLEKWLGEHDSDDFQEDLPPSEDGVAALDNGDHDQAVLDEETAKIQNEEFQREDAALKRGAEPARDTPANTVIREEIPQVTAPVQEPAAEVPAQVQPDTTPAARPEATPKGMESCKDVWEAIVTSDKIVFAGMTCDDLMAIVNEGRLTIIEQVPVGP